MYGTLSLHEVGMRVKDENDLNKNFLLLSPDEIPRFIETVENNLPKLIKTKGALVRAMQGLSEEKLNLVVNLLRVKLPNFTRFADEHLNPEGVVNLRTAGRALLEGKPPERENLVQAIFGKKAAFVNRSISNLYGLGGVEDALRLALSANQLEARLAQVGIKPSERISELTDALMQNDPDAIRERYHALLDTFPKEERTTANLSSTVVSGMLALAFGTAMAITENPGYFALPFMGSLITAGYLYFSKETQRPTQQHDDFCAAVARIDSDLRGRLNEALELNITQASQNNTSGVQKALMLHDKSYFTEQNHPLGELIDPDADWEELDGTDTPSPRETDSSDDDLVVVQKPGDSDDEPPSPTSPPTI